VEVYLLLAQRNVHEHIVHQEDANRAAVRLKIDWLMSPWSTSSINVLN
jgi:hypothetical protein